MNGDSFPGGEAQRPLPSGLIHALKRLSRGEKRGSWGEKRPERG